MSVILCNLVSISCCWSSLCLNTLSIFCQIRSIILVKCGVLRYFTLDSEISSEHLTFNSLRVIPGTRPRCFGRFDTDCYFELLALLVSTAILGNTRLLCFTYVWCFHLLSLYTFPLQTLLHQTSIIKQRQRLVNGRMSCLVWGKKTWQRLNKYISKGIRLTAWKNCFNKDII